MLARQFGTCDEVHLLFIVLAEIRAGFLGGSRTVKHEALLQAFLTRPTVQVLIPNLDTASADARLFVQLRQAGTPIPGNDLWIAALCLQHHLTLITRDRHFRRIPQLLRA